MSFRDLKIGDEVIRLLAGTIPMWLKITDLTDNSIKCGAWTFDRDYGYEIDESIGFGKQADGTIFTGSYLRLPAEMPTTEP